MTDQQIENLAAELAQVYKKAWDASDKKITMRNPDLTALANIYIAEEVVKIYIQNKINEQKSEEIRTMIAAKSEMRERIDANRKQSMRT